MGGPKPYEFIGFVAMDATKPYKFKGFVAMDATKPYKFIGLVAMNATKPYKFIGFLSLEAIMPRNENYSLSFVFSAIFRPSLAPRPTPTGQARRMAQNAPKISTGD